MGVSVASALRSALRCHEVKRDHFFVCYIFTPLVKGRPMLGILASLKPPCVSVLKNELAHSLTCFYMNLSMSATSSSTTSVVKTPKSVRSSTGNTEHNYDTFRKCFLLNSKSKAYFFTFTLMAYIVTFASLQWIFCRYGWSMISSTGSLPLAHFPI